MQNLQPNIYKNQSLRLFHKLQKLFRAVHKPIFLPTEKNSDNQLIRNIMFHGMLSLYGKNCQYRRYSSYTKNPTMKIFFSTALGINRCLNKIPGVWRPKTTISLWRTPYWRPPEIVIIRSSLSCTRIAENTGLYHFSSIKTRRYKTAGIERVVSSRTPSPQ